MGAKITLEEELTEEKPASVKVTFRTDADLKKQAERVFESMGMTTSNAINIFLRQVVREQRLPFHPGATPEEMGENSFEAMLTEADTVLSGKGTKTYTSYEELLIDEK